MNPEQEGFVLRGVAVAYAVLVVALALAVGLDDLDVVDGPASGWLVVCTAPLSLLVLSVIGLLGPGVPDLLQVVLYLAAGLAQAALLRSAGQPGR